MKNITLSKVISWALMMAIGIMSVTTLADYTATIDPAYRPAFAASAIAIGMILSYLTGLVWRYIMASHHYLRSYPLSRNAFFYRQLLPLMLWSFGVGVIFTYCFATFDSLSNVLYLSVVLMIIGLFILSSTIGFLFSLSMTKISRVALFRYLGYLGSLIIFATIVVNLNVLQEPFISPTVGNVIPFVLSAVLGIALCFVVGESIFNLKDQYRSSLHKPLHARHHGPTILTTLESSHPAIIVFSYLFRHNLRDFYLWLRLLMALILVVVFYGITASQNAPEFFNLTFTAIIILQIAISLSETESDNAKTFYLRSQHLPLPFRSIQIGGIMSLALTYTIFAILMIYYWSLGLDPIGLGSMIALVLGGLIIAKLGFLLKTRQLS